MDYSRDLLTTVWAFITQGVYDVLRIYYLRAPRWMGGWEGDKWETICESIGRLRFDTEPRYGTKMTLDELCEKQIRLRVEGYQVALTIAFVIIFTYSGLRA